MNYRHGKANSKAYRAWGGMRARCNNPNNRAYANYGGRGIRVCDRWENFNSFYEDMGDPPPGLTLERRDNDKGYSPSNCIWVSRTEQSRNRRNLHLVTIGSETLPLSQWVERMGAARLGTVRRRIYTGWEPEKAITTPTITKRKCLPWGCKIHETEEPQFGGVPLSEVIAASGLSHNLVIKRLERGWSVSDALSCPPRKGRRIRTFGARHGVRFNDPMETAA